MPQTQRSKAMKIKGTFLDEISHDIPHQNWGEKEWDVDFGHMRSAGIDTVILIRSGYRRWQTFPSKVLTEREGCFVPPLDLVEMFLRLSDKWGMKFFFGLYDSGKYWDKGDYEKALECFYRIEFNNPGDANAIRPLAWCLFLLNRTAEASAFYKQLLEMEPNEFDFMNAGHVAWCQSRHMEAAIHYKTSIRKRKGDLNTFLKAFASDKPYLLKNGLSEREIQMMLDYISMGQKQ